jgi:hypothetical protein
MGPTSYTPVPAGARQKPTRAGQRPTLPSSARRFEPNPGARRRPPASRVTTLRRSVVEALQRIHVPNRFRLSQLAPVR